MKPLNKRINILGKLLPCALIAFFAFSFLMPPVQAAGDQKGDVPILKVGYIFTNHHTPLIVAAAKGEDFKSMGTYLKPIVPKERYELISDGEKIAVIDLVVTKSGSESTTLFAQKHLDLALASITAVMAGIDQGTPLKILSPLQVEGMSLVFPKDNLINDWNGLMKHISSTKEPVKIGYHSPTSAPKIVIERGLAEAGVKVTQDANDSSAKVLLVDLKSTSNLIPALVGKQVDGWVGPSPFPEVAVAQGAGKIIADLRDLPPKGFWNDFPCCVVAAREDAIAKYPQAVGKFVEVVVKSGEWCNKNKSEMGELTAGWIGIPAAAAKASCMVYINNFSDSWVRGAGIYMEILNDMGNFKGQLKGKPKSELKSIMLNPSFVEKVKLQ